MEQRHFRIICLVLLTLTKHFFAEDAHMIAFRLPHAHVHMSHKSHARPLCSVVEAWEGRSCVLIKLVRAVVFGKNYIGVCVS